MTLIESQLLKATVYTHSSVQLVRHAQTSVEQTGEQTLQFWLPTNQIEQDSIQVSGGGKALLKDVKLTKKYTTIEQNDKLGAFREQRAKLEEEKTLLEAKLNRVKSEQTLLEGMVDKIITPQVGEKEVKLEFSPEVWAKTLDFYRERIGKLDEETFTLEKDVNKIDEELTALRKSEQLLTGASSKAKNVLEVVLDIQEAGDMEFQISYLAKGASWYPNYDIRVDSGDNSLQLSYNAMVRNNTGEDWRNVRLGLSTAKPFISGTPPTLRAWFLHKIVPEPPKKVRKPRPNFSKKSMAAPAMERKAEVFAELDENWLGGEIPDMEMPEVEVEGNVSSVVFNIAGGSTITADNQPQKVSILKESFKTDFKHLAVPSQSPHAYLQAEITNESDFPLLAGETSIFMDNHFVSKSKIDFISPLEKFKIDLGIDENVKLEHKQLEKQWSSEGFLTKNKKKITFSYQITIENKKQKPIHINVSDQIPKSTDEEIQIELLKPKHIDENSGVSLNEDKILKWQLEIAASEKKLLDLEYSVMYPKDLRTELG